MGAAIPHLLQLSQALPPILPFPASDIHMEVLTGTVEVTDEILPDDEDEDISYQNRGKSTLNIVIRIGDGNDGIKRTGNNHTANGKKGGSSGEKGVREGKKGKAKSTQKQPEQVVLQEPEQDDMVLT
jgi:ribonuclease P/MRP protein subunit RPP20